MALWTKYGTIHNNSYETPIWHHRYAQVHRIARITRVYTTQHRAQYMHNITYIYYSTIYIAPFNIIPYHSIAPWTIYYHVYKIITKSIRKVYQQYSMTPPNAIYYFVQLFYIVYECCMLLYNITSCTMYSNMVTLYNIALSMYNTALMWDLTPCDCPDYIQPATLANLRDAILNSAALHDAYIQRNMVHTRKNTHRNDWNISSDPQIGNTGLHPYSSHATSDRATVSQVLVEIGIRGRNLDSEMKRVNSILQTSFFLSSFLRILFWSSAGRQTAAVLLTAAATVWLSCGAL